MVAVVSTREMPHIDTEADGQGQDGAGPPDGSAPARSDRAMRARIRSAPTGPGRWTAIAFLTTGAVIVAAAALAFYRTTGDEEPLPDPPPLVMEGGPVVTYMGSTYQIGRPGDVAVVRSCEGRAKAWLLRPSTGAIYRFDSWATDGMAVTSPIRTVLGADRLRLVRSLGCTDVHVETTDGRSIPLTDGS